MIKVMKEQTLYHASNYKIRKFDPSKSKEIGLHVGTIKAANAFKTRKYLYKVEIDDNARFFKMKHDYDFWSTLEVVKDLDPDNYLNNVAELRKDNNLNARKISDFITNWLLDHNYDGIQYKNASEHRGSISYIIVNPKVVTSIELYE